MFVGGDEVVNFVVFFDGIVVVGFGVSFCDGYVVDVFFWIIGGVYVDVGWFFCVGFDDFFGGFVDGFFYGYVIVGVVNFVVNDGSGDGEVYFVFFFEIYNFDVFIDGGVFFFEFVVVEVFFGFKDDFFGFVEWGVVDIKGGVVGEWDWVFFSFVEDFNEVNVFLFDVGVYDDVVFEVEVFDGFFEVVFCGFKCYFMDGEEFFVNYFDGFFGEEDVDWFDDFIVVELWVGFFVDNFDLVGVVVENDVVFFYVFFGECFVDGFGYIVGYVVGVIDIFFFNEFNFLYFNWGFDEFFNDYVFDFFSYEYYFFFDLISVVVGFVYCFIYFLV